MAEQKEKKEIDRGLKLLNVQGNYIPRAGGFEKQTCIHRLLYLRGNSFQYVLSPVFLKAKFLRFTNLNLTGY